MVGVGADFAKTKRLRTSLPSIVRREGWWGAVTRAYGVRGIPNVAVIDPNGQLVYVGKLKEAIAKVDDLVGG